MILQKVMFNCKRFSKGHELLVALIRSVLEKNILIIEV